MGPLWLVPAIPLVAAGLIGLMPRRSPHFGFVATTAAAGSALLLGTQFWTVIGGATRASELLRFAVAGREVAVGLSADALSSVMALLVALVGSLVLVYSVGYMCEEPGQRRFFAVMSLFLGSMLALVLASDYLLLYVSWELVGLCSYLLIGHYWKEAKAQHAALKAFIVTRIGDLGLLLGVALLFLHTGGTGFSTAFSALGTRELTGPPLTLIAFLLLAGALGKSAQFPLHLWLPDAMAGPTPVSALIHSATMVAAGIYLIARSFPVFAAAPLALTTLGIIATISALGAALAALVQSDVKRVLAYSTVSQLAEMGIALALSLPALAIFHLISHATFKALLFLSAGAATLSSGTNELHRLKATRLAHLGFLVGALSLAGIAPFSGFWSKEAIVSAVGSPASYLLGLLAFLSALYIARAFFLGFPAARAKATGEHGWMTVGVYSLMVLTAMVGFIQSPVGNGWLARFLGTPREPHLGWGTIMHLLIAVAGWLVAWTVYHRRVISPQRVRHRLSRLHSLLFGGFGTDRAAPVLANGGLTLTRAAAALDRSLFERTAEMLGRWSVRLADWARHLDQATFDAFAEGTARYAVTLASRSRWADERLLDRSITGGAWKLNEFGGWVRGVQTGRIYHYLAAVFLWVLVVAALTIGLRW